MSNNKTFKILSNIISNKVTKGETFTAFNISLEAKKKGVLDKHSNLRNDIHTIMSEYINDGDYTRKIVQVGTEAYQRAWVYYPTTSKAPSTMSRSQVLSTTSSNSSSKLFKIPSVKTSKKRSKSTSNSLVKGLSSENRLLIPKSLTTKAGIVRSAYAFVGKDNTLILRNSAPTKHEYVKYTVDSHGNTRIGQRVLKDAGFSVNKNSIFKLDYNNGSIVIRKG